MCPLSLERVPESRGGDFTWQIPAVWSIDTTNTHALPWTPQICSLGADGTVTVEKLGHSVVRHVNASYGTAQ